MLIEFLLYLSIIGGLLIISVYLSVKLAPDITEKFFRDTIGDIFILVAKGANYFKEDLVQEALKTEDGVVIRQLLPKFPFGRLYAALIHGPDNNEILNLLNTDDPAFREPNLIFASLIPGLANNPTDASFFLDATKDARDKRQRSLIKYIQDQTRLNRIFTECVQEFTKLFEDPNFWSLNNGILEIVYRVVGRVMMGFDHLNFDKMNRMIQALDEAINHGSHPNIFSFISPSQQIVLRAKETVDIWAKHILVDNAASILATDNYTNYIVKQSAQIHKGEPDNFILHKDVIASSPVLFLGIDNISGPLGYALLHLYNKDLYDNTGFIDQIKSECKNIRTYSDAKASGSLDKLYLESMRIFRPARIIIRKLSREFKFGKHTLPANTLIALSIGTILEDKKYWGSDANSFNPDRFDRFPNISGANPKQFPFIPFSIGLRSCPGYLIANAVMLAFYTSLFSKNYQVIWHQNNPPMSAIPLKNNLVKIPFTFKARMVSLDK